MMFSVFLAVFGGYVRHVRNDFNEFEHKPLFSLRLINDLLIAAFSGLIVCSLMGFLGLANKDIQSVFAGVAGYGSPAFLDDVVSRLRSMFLSRLDDKTKLDKEEQDILKAVSGDL